MKTTILSAALALLAAIPVQARNDGKTSGNPIFKGWYADPEGAVLDGQYWVFPTYSADFDDQTFMDAFSSPDLVTWTKHPRVLDKKDVSWARRAMWAPAVMHANGKYYLFFSANDVHEGEVGGIGVATASRPEGPYKDALGKPLINEIVNGAQPIDQFVFRDDDGQYYMYYGGWGHCNVAKMSPDLMSIVPFADGSKFREVTPENYVEGPFMLKRKGKYYFMWSEGGWGGPDYCVAYAIADSPFGPFRRVGKILQQDPAVATGAGHHSVIQVPGKDEYYIVYHRRPLTETGRDCRETCIDRLYFDKQGNIVPVKMTFEGVKKVKAPKTNKK
uniref:glycoside hydrolase family 43 protein n=1 Tax=Prevotella sp. TaxID=59823 RepID=UPI003FEE89EC